MNSNRRDKSISALLTVAGLILLAGLTWSLTGGASDAEAEEERAYRRENARKVSHGWNEGRRFGRDTGVARSAKASPSSREIAGLASLKRSEAGINCPVEGRSFERGFVFGFHEGYHAQEGFEP